MTGPTDVAPLFAAPAAGPSQGVGVRQGTVITWNRLTAENTIDVGGTVLADLPILNTSEALLLEPGAVVTLLAVGEGAKTFGILGRYTAPGTAAAASALAIVRTFSASVGTVESTTSTSYTDLATVGPIVADVLVGLAGRCLVTVSTEIRSQASAGSAISTGAGFMNFEVTGATALGPLDDWAAQAWIRYEESAASTKAIDIRAGLSRQTLLTGLTSGLHTFTARYKCGSSTNAATFDGRNITVVPL